MRTLAIFLVQAIGTASALLCHRKECSDPLGCMQGWDTCASDKYCFMYLFKNTTNPQNFTLRRGCTGDPRRITFNAELQPYKSLNECHRIVWRDIEYLVKVCADGDFCNLCHTWTERAPVPASAGPGQFPSTTVLFGAFIALIFGRVIT